MHGVENIEEVLARRTFVFWICVREVLQELLVALKLREEALDRKLIIVRHIDMADLLLLQQLLLPCEHVAEEVLGKGALAWKIVLHCSKVDKHVRINQSFGRHEIMTGITTARMSIIDLILMKFHLRCWSR